jgi:hypothetical protein
VLRHGAKGLHIKDSRFSTIVENTPSTYGTNLFIKAVIEDPFQHSTFINPEVEMEKLAIVTLRQRYLPCRMSHARMGQIQYEWNMI